MVTALQEQFARKWEGKLCVLIRIFSAKISSHTGPLQNFSQSTWSLRGNFLWIGERPIQRRLVGLIFPLKKLGQKSDASTFSLCEL
jgi:hypothetical protein